MTSKECIQESYKQNVKDYFVAYEIYDAAQQSLHSNDKTVELHSGIVRKNLWDKCREMSRMQLGLHEKIKVLNAQRVSLGMSRISDKCSYGDVIQRLMNEKAKEQA